MTEIEPNGRPPILLTGASGYVGRRMVPRLLPKTDLLRCLARDPEKLRPRVDSRVEVVAGDVDDQASLERAMRGVHTAYYLVHRMSNSKDFEREDREAATHFAGAARHAGVKRIIYLGGLGSDADPGLSPHLRSRHEVGAIFRDEGVETIEFRAALVIGSGSLSYQLLTTLTNRLPVMLCPSWLSTRTQPIAVDDILAYLEAALDLPPGESRIFEVGGADSTNYGDLIREYARQKGLTRVLIPIPVLSPKISGLWLKLIVPSLADVGSHLVEGLRNPTVVQDSSARRAFAIDPVGISEAIRRAFDEPVPED